MKEDFVTYDLAVKLKEKGFKEKCYAYYYPKGSVLIFNKNQFRGGIVEDCLYSNNSLPNECMASDFVDAPTIYQVLKWLREKKIFVAINIGYCYESYGIPFPINPKMEPILKGYYYGIWALDNLNDENARSKYFEYYEQAAIAGIEFVIDNLI